MNYQEAQGLPIFSFYKGPITNSKPYKSLHIIRVYNALTSDYYKVVTEKLRASTTIEEKRSIKQTLDYVTFAGTFSQRKNDCLIQYSGYVCIDFDHIELENIAKLKELLLNDQMFETQLLFISPSGSGIKWIVAVDLNCYPGYELNYRGIISYLKRTYMETFFLKSKYIDESGKDVSRACFLCFDPNAYINPKYLCDGR